MMATQRALQLFETFKAQPPQKQILWTGAVLSGVSVALSIFRFCYNQLRHGSRPKEVHYEVTGDMNKCKEMVIFIHGWPDFGYLWESQIELLSQNGYCCINLEIPNFHVDRVQNPWGYEFMAVVDAMGEQIATLTEEGQKTCNLVTHDWGCFIGQHIYLKFQHRINCKKLVLLDVADGSPKEERQSTKYIYQVFLAAYFLMPSWLGTWRMRHFFKFAERMSRGQFKLPLFEKERKDNRWYMHSTSSYLYYYVMIKSLIFGRIKELDVTSRLHKFDGLPILFVDGKKGEDPMRFWTDTFKQHIEERDYCQWVEYDSSGHWIMIDEQEKFNALLLQFLQRK